MVNPLNRMIPHPNFLYLRLTSTAPGEVVASWPKSNYINPETRGDGLCIVSLSLAELGIVVVGSRLYSRWFITKAIGLDDFTVVIALAFSIALSTMIIIGNKVYYSGRHIWDIPASKFVGHRHNVWVSLLSQTMGSHSLTVLQVAQLLYASALSTVKVSILLSYRRLTGTVSRRFVIAIWIGIMYNIVLWIGFCGALIFLCSPINTYWKQVDLLWRASHHPHCGNESLMVTLTGILSIIGDFYSALLPILLIMSLNLSRRQKRSLNALFAIAFLVVGAGIARTVLVNKVISKDYDVS
jgi:hypothetical protein